MIRGLKGNGTYAGYALTLQGVLGEAADTAKSTGAHGVVTLHAQVQSGTGQAAVGANGNLVTIRNYGTTRFIFDAEGDAHSDVSWTTFAGRDDLALLSRLEQMMVGDEFGAWAQENRMELERLNIAHFDETPGHAMINLTRLSMLLTGALRQAGARLAALEARI